MVNKRDKYENNLSTKSVRHKIKRSIRRYEGYSSIIFKSSQAYTPKKVKGVITISKSWA